MIYLDSGATSLRKPRQVARAVSRAILRCANPGRGGYPAAMESSRVLLHCRTVAGELFDCDPEQVVFTGNCTHGLNIAINSLIKPGSRVLITGFEHNAVTRPLYSRGARTVVAGRRLFDWEDTLEQFEKGLKSGVSAAVFTHCSNVFGYIMPVEQMAQLCRQYAVPFIIDAAQSAGTMPVKLRKLGADFIAMPGHKGLLGPQGTGLLLCAGTPKALIQGGTGSNSASNEMPDFLPDLLEAGTVNVPGIAGLFEGLSFLKRVGVETIGQREHEAAALCAEELKKLGMKVFSGPHQAGTVSFQTEEDCEELAQKLAGQGIAVRAGLHCAPLAHQSAETFQRGTVRVSFGIDASAMQVRRLIQALKIAENGKNNH